MWSCEKSTRWFLNREGASGSGGSDLKLVERKHEREVLIPACPFFYSFLIDRSWPDPVGLFLKEKGRLKRRGVDKKREKGEEGRELVCMAHRAQIKPFNVSVTRWVGCDFCSWALCTSKGLDLVGTFGTRYLHALRVLLLKLVILARRSAFPWTETLVPDVSAGCHPSCKTCTGGGPSSCSSCNTSLVLSHTSTCVPVCSPGYYRDDRQTCRRECLSPSHLSFPQCIHRHVFSCSVAYCSSCQEKKDFKCLKIRRELTEVISCLRNRAYSMV